MPLKEKQSTLINCYFKEAKTTLPLIKLEWQDITVSNAARDLSFVIYQDFVVFWLSVSWFYIQKSASIFKMVIQ